LLTKAIYIIFLFNFWNTPEFVAVNIAQYIKIFCNEIKLCFMCERHSNFSRFAISLSQHSMSSHIYKRVLAKFR